LARAGSPPAGRVKCQRTRPDRRWNDQVAERFDRGTLIVQTSSMRFLCCHLIAACLAAANPVAAETGPCSTPAHRIFDFWLGEWQVQRPDGTIAGINRIEVKHDGCVLREQYTGSGGYSGESLNIYDPARGVWHQTWVDSSGLLLLLEGGMRGGSMILEGQTIGDDGESIRQRITWTPNADGTIRQLWESTDAEGQWGTVFDGLYSRTP
jgi:hypothetical protein